MVMTTKYALDLGKFISDLPIDISNYLTHLESPTGCGKSTFFIEELSKTVKIVFLCAVNVQVAQIAADYIDNPNVQCITKETSVDRLSGQVIVCVYDKLAAIQGQLTNPNDYVLVIDEAHKIYQAAGYRQVALSVIVDAITSKTFKQVVTVSATFIPDIFPVEFDEQIIISRQVQRQSAVDVIFHDNTKQMEESLIQIRPSEGMVAIVRINDKKQIKLTKCCFELQGLRVLEVHSGNQQSPEVIALLTSSTVTDYDIVLTTSLLDEAINIKNENIESTHAFHRLHIDELKQFIGRCRNSVPQVELHLLNSELERRNIDMSVERANIDATCMASLTFALALGKKTSNYTRIVKQVNATAKEACGFEPLRYDYLSSQLPCIDNVAVLAKLYEVAMQKQYVNDESLHQALLLSECFSDVNIYQPNTPLDKETQSVITKAGEIQAEAKASAVEQCLTELNCPDGNVSHLTISDIGNLVENHQQSGEVGEIATSWNALCFILPTEQALDVVVKNREILVWEFHSAVTKRIDYQPFFNKIKADITRDGQVALIGSDAINKYFIDALSMYAKGNPDFKEFIGKLSGSKIQVLKNNKFKLSNRFLYPFIRGFTDHEERRTGGVQCFIIKGIGLFGYDYKIRQLMTASPKKPKRLFPNAKKPTGHAAVSIDGDELPF
jgi:hypothetical protein